MSKYRDLVGKRFGQLTVIKRSQKRDAVNSSYKWVCLCDCVIVEIISYAVQTI